MEDLKAWGSPTSPQSAAAAARWLAAAAAGRSRRPRSQELPRSTRSWLGAWGEGSEELKGMPQLARDDGGAGAFWMALEDAVAAFGAALAVRIFGEGWQAMGCEASWRADSAGGMPTEASWCDLARSPPGMRRLAPPPSGLLHLGHISDAHAPSCSGRAPRQV